MRFSTELLFVQDAATIFWGTEFQDSDLAPLSVRLSTQVEERFQASKYDVLVALLYSEAVDVSVTGSQQMLFHCC